MKVRIFAIVVHFGWVLLAAVDFENVVDLKSDKTVFSGKAKLTHRAKDVTKVDAGSDVWELDFTSVTKPGDYCLSVSGVGRSIAFAIGDSVYAKAFKVQTQGIYCQRCGCEIDPKLSGGWKLIACHKDGIVPTSVKRSAAGEWGDFVHNTLPGKLKAKGGHHDAGDYNPRSHLDVAQRLMELVELRPSVCQDGELNIPERGNGIPDVMDEAFKSLCPWTKNPRAEITVWKKYDMRDAARQYLLLPKALRDEKLWADILNAVKAEYSVFVNGNAKNPYKFLKNPWAPVVWGSGAYENDAVNAGFYYALTGDKMCRDWLIRTCDNTLGANPLGLSWVTGLGERTIRCPLHNCRYRPNGLPVVGLQGQGPNQNAAGYSVPETTYPRPEAAKANLHTFVDTHFAIAMDEPTVNNMVNSLFIFGLLR